MESDSETWYGPDGGDESVELPMRDWETVLALSESALGFRHISSEEKMIDDQKKGFYGDALAIHNVSRVVPSAVIPMRIQKLAKGYNIKDVRDIAPLSAYVQELTDEQKREIVHRFRRAVMSFISQSFNFTNNPPSKGQEVRSVLNTLRQQHGFLIVECPNSSPRDANDENLGKVGKQEFTASHIKGSISMEEIIQHLPLSAIEEDSTADDALFVKLSETVYQLLMEKSASIIGTEG